MTAGPRPAQARLQFFLRLSPARVLRPRSSGERGAVFFDVFDSCLVIPAGLFKGGFGCGDGPLTALAFFRALGLFPVAFAVAALLLLLERPRGLASRLVVHCLSRRLAPLRRMLRRGAVGGGGGEVPGG